MSVGVVGSIAFDTIKTPFGERQQSLGGAANYFSLSAHYFTKVHMVGVIGQDYPESHLNYLKSRGIDITGVDTALGNSFHWQGEYGYDLNEAKTINTELNVFEHFRPYLTADFKKLPTIFLANIDPELQIHVLEQMTAPRIKALDSMNFWIKTREKALKKVISMVDILFINEAEVRALTGEYNIIKAAKAAMQMGAEIVVIKRGEYGSLLCYGEHMAFMPAFPTEEVFDPTGAGDAFAGGFIGYLDTCSEINPSSLRMAMVMGTVMSSFVIEQFSFDRLIDLSTSAIEQRKNRLLALIHGAH